MIKFCPHCKSAKIKFDGVKKYFCGACGWTYYQNAATAVMAFLVLDKKILFTVRAKEPSKNMLDLPGGFVEPGENAEEALKREIKEELGLEIKKLNYIGSAANEYPYKNVIYNTCDLIFYSKINIKPPLIKKSEIKNYIFKNPNEIGQRKLAFKSVKEAMKLFKKMAVIPI